MIEIVVTGSTERTEAKLKKLIDQSIFAKFDEYGREGCEALASVTPEDTGLTAGSWTYEIRHEKGMHSITWHNSNMAGGTPVAILLQYGHGTGTGGYVQGQDYINPVIKPLFERIKNDVWKAVSSA